MAARRPNRNKTVLVVIAGVVMLAITVGLRLADPPFVAAVRELTFDYYQRLWPREYQALPVRIVDIDDASLKEFGQWPWPRTRIAKLVDRLTELGAASIAFDMVFSEADRTSPARFAESIDLGGTPDAARVRALLSRLPDNDTTLAETLVDKPVILGFAALTNKSGGLPQPKAGVAFAGTDPTQILSPFASALTSLPKLQEGASGAGGISLSHADTGGVVRRIPLLFSSGKALYPSLAIEALRLAQGASGFLVRSTGASGEADTGRPAIAAVRVGAFTIPTTADGELWVYYTPARAERYVSLRDLFDPQRQAAVRDRLEGNIVFVGTSAVGLNDIRATPLGGLVPGVSVHAQAAEQIIAGTYLSRPDWADGLENLITVALGLLVIAALVATGPVPSAVIGAVLALSGVAVAVFAFREASLLIDPIYPSLSALVVYGGAALQQYIVSDREKRFVRRAFAQYLAPELLSKLEEQPDAMKLGGEMRALSIMFMDVRGFTPISEMLAPQDLVHFLNTLLSPLSDAIQLQAGTIDKYIGDSIMAFWNAPLETPDHAALACRAALRMREIVVELNAADAFGFKAGHKPIQEVQIGVGINTGPACVGNMGSDRRFNYSVVGDAVNVAARIESSCKAVGSELLVSEDTVRAAPGFAYLEAGEIPLKGKSQPVALFALAGDQALAATPEFAALKTQHERLIAAWHAGDGWKADMALTACRKAAPDHLATFYDRFADRVATIRGGKT
ncbi:adenylate/guanylate cyclase [Breoghania corrubedonensis]|uniref:Adenylate/guanylate cyclase n=1 Tax=Breoghania corrubedonensis TaxID=665038 RepID=A0A2T5V7I8_9HYPH|nr:adenylate/guanylate cyclase domain-containing protein [Breoghania corrubedonensis]PTW59709.1 adenylate/guanylate cyclase [Breoghania corrubedonensis]